MIGGISMASQLYRISGLLEVFRYRYMIGGLVKRELRGRYKGSVAGFLWNYITPVMQIIVYSAVFSQIIKVGIENYFAYLIIGLLPWTFLSDSLVEGSNSFIQYSELVKKNYFPRCVIPIAVVTSKLINWAIAYTLAIVFLMCFSFELTASFLLLPFVMALLYIFVLGISMILSALNVYFRDIQHITSIVMMVWIWITPIMYSQSMIDNETLCSVINSNPLTYFIEMFHSIMYYGTWPEISAWIVPIVCSLTSIFCGYLIIKLTQKKIAELI